MKEMVSKNARQREQRSEGERERKKGEREK